MSLEAILSSSPTLAFEGRADVEPLRGWYEDLHGPDGWRAWWIVPTSRRRRRIVQETASASRLPRVLTLDGLLQHLQGFGRDQRRTIGNTGQLLRLARAWQQVNPTGSLTPGRILQLQRIASDWRDSGSPPPAQHPHARFLRELGKIIAKDGFLDRPAALDALAREIAEEGSPLAGILRGRRILFDGFHRFSDSEWRLIEAIGQPAHVRLWLVAAEGQPYYVNVVSALERRKIAAIRDERPAPSTNAALGRSLFSDGPAESRQVTVIGAATADAECHAVAVQIKSLMRQWGDAGRLSEIAVVIPDDNYLPLLKSTFRAARIDYSPAAEVFALAESRPARVLLLALRLIRHGWQTEALFDFLRQPLLFRRLQKNHRLEWLRQRSGHAMARHDWKSWKKNWSELIANHAKSALADEETRDESPEERQEQAERLVGDLSELLKSIDEVLAPIEKLEKELAGKPGSEPTGLVAAIARLLDAIHASTWLSPAEHPDWSVIPSREWEIDQLAFNNLKDVFVELSDTPAGDLPRDADKRVDVELVLKLALVAEAFQTSAEDDAGVQILRPRTIRGSKFRAIFAVGLVEGKVPRDIAENPATADDDSPIAHLRNEEQREQEYLFAQLFESARECIVLSRPRMENDAPLMESPFLRRVRVKLGIKEVSSDSLKRERGAGPSATIIDLRHALLYGDRAEFQNDAVAQRILAVRAVWSQRQKDNELQIEPWALPLMALRYPPERPFSATALEKYASCPFHHFAARTLGLEELERDDAAMRWGSFLHDVLERFFKERSESASPSARERFLELLRKHWPNVAHTLDATYLHDFETVLANAFETVNAFLGKEGFEQIGSEWEEKAIEIPDGKGGTLRLHVKIDRIDRRASDGVELICDFKTGNVTSGAILKERIRVGRALQLPLYGYGRQIAAAGTRVVHGLYVKLSRKVNGTPDKHGPFLVHVGEVLPMHARTVKIDFNPEAAGKRAAELANDMLAGRIKLSLYDVDHKDPACQAYCSARHACRHPKGYKF